MQTISNAEYGSVAPGAEGSVVAAPCNTEVPSWSAAGQVKIFADAGEATGQDGPRKGEALTRPTDRCGVFSVNAWIFQCLGVGDKPD